MKEFADKLFAMKEGELSEPVKTQFGYHIIRLDGIRATTGRTFDEVKGELTATLRNEQAATLFGTGRTSCRSASKRAPAASTTW